jgi:hypothetical protein
MLRIHWEHSGNTLWITKIAKIQDLAHLKFFKKTLWTLRCTLHHLIGWTQFLFLIYPQTPIAKNDPFGKEKKLNIQSSPSPLPKFPSYNLIFHSTQILKGQNLSIKPTFDPPTLYLLKRNFHNTLQAVSFQIITRILTIHYKLCLSKSSQDFLFVAGRNLAQSVSKFEVEILGN